MKNLLNHISKITPEKNDGVIEIIPINRVLTFNASSPLYSPASRKINHYYDDCYVVSIDGKIKATLRNNKNPYANCVIYEGVTLIFNPC
jgi:hypothetical protein